MKFFHDTDDDDDNPKYFKTQPNIITYNFILF